MPTLIISKYFASKTIAILRIILQVQASRIKVGSTDILDYIENPVEKKQLKIYSLMVKKGTRGKNSIIRREGQQNKAVPTQKQSQCVRLKENFTQFFEFLKDHHALENRTRALLEGEVSLLQQISIQLLSFFNENKNYTIRELDMHVIYFANLLGLLGTKVSTLTFTSEFKVKIKKIIFSLKEGGRSQQRESTVQQALFYILALFIFREGEQTNNSLKTINKSIFSDRKLVKQLLSLTIIQEKKTTKFFGVILIHLCSKFKGKYSKEDMMVSIFKNLGKIVDESIFFQLLGYLRRQMNQSNINLCLINEEQVVQVLIENYSKYSSKQHSYFILQYLNYLISLFPTLSNIVYEEKYIRLLFHSYNEQNVDKQVAIVKIIDQVLHFGQLDKKSMILENVIKNIDLSLQIGKIFIPLIIKHETDQTKLINFLHIGCFSHLFEQILPGTEETTLKNRIEILLILIKKVEKINQSISLYLRSKLKSKIDLLSEDWRIIYQHLIRLDEQSS